MTPSLADKRLARAQAKLAVMERLLEDKSRELYEMNAEIRRSKDFLEHVFATMPSALIVADELGAILRVNAAAADLFERPMDSLIGAPLHHLFHDSDPLTREQVQELFTAEQAVSEERVLNDAQGGQLPALFYASARKDDRRIPYLVCIAADLRERKHLEVELRHAQKLEAVGQLSAGVAHEVNTPIQFVGDGVHFLREAFADIQLAVGAYETTWEALSRHASVEQREALRVALEEADLDFIQAEVPLAFERTLDGVQRVTRIVSAMKQFSHFEATEKTLANINDAIRNTLVVAASEYKHVADVETDLGELPDILCHIGDINQVLLNLVVNAAHAVAEKAGVSSQQRGLLFIGTRRHEDSVEVLIRDDGCGIPEEIRNRIFDPFFTTKEVGKGTGQGLAIARNVVVDKHGGQLLVQSAANEGSTFTIRLPVSPRPSGRDVEAA